MQDERERWYPSLPQIKIENNFAVMQMGGRRIFVLRSMKPHGRLIKVAGITSTAASSAARE